MTGRSPTAPGPEEPGPEEPGPSTAAAPEPPAAAPDRRGLLTALAAYTLWGLFPAFWPLLAPAGSLETLAHRVAWTLVGMVGVLTVLSRRAPRGRSGTRRARSRWGSWDALRGLPARTWALITGASVLITANWGVYIWGVTHGRVLDAALGYYVNPLLSVLLAVVVLGERLCRRQWVALGLAAAAVAVLTATAGTTPWVALVLAATFACYGLLKKRVPLDPVPGLTAEGFLLGPVAIGYLVVLEAAGTGTFLGHGVGHALLLAASGPVTALPLLLFAAGARRLPLATLGVLQYVNPTMQFLWGLLVDHEPMPAARWVGFALVWAAVVLFVVRPRRRPQPTRSTV